jgi:tripartite-type tricarboxylate transporter receptor subunit TctC
MRWRGGVVVCGAWIAACGFEAGAQAPAGNYPLKQIRAIVPFAPGGPTDTMARAIGQKLTEAWSQPVIIDNRPGAGGNIATEIAAKSPPDGYTLFMGTVANAINHSLFAKLPFDFQRDFAPVTQNYITGLILAVHPSLPVKSVKELVALAKTRPGALSYSSNGVGGTPHMPGELLFLQQGVELAPSTPEEFGAFIRQDVAKWAKVIQLSGAHAA